MSPAFPSRSGLQPRPPPWKTQLLLYSEHSLPSQDLHHCLPSLPCAVSYLRPKRASAASPALPASRQRLVSRDLLPRRPADCLQPGCALPPMREGGGFRPDAQPQLTGLCSMGTQAPTALPASRDSNMGAWHLHPPRFPTYLSPVKAFSRVCTKAQTTQSPKGSPGPMYSQGWRPGGVLFSLPHAFCFGLPCQQKLPPRRGRPVPGCQTQWPCFSA